MSEWQEACERRHARREHMKWLDYITRGHYLCPVCDQRMHEGDYVLRTYGETAFISTEEPLIWTPVPARYPVHETCEVVGDMWAVIRSHWKRVAAQPPN